MPEGGGRAHHEFASTCIHDSDGCRDSDIPHDSSIQMTIATRKLYQHAGIHDRFEKGTIHGTGASDPVPGQQTDSARIPLQEPVLF